MQASVTLENRDGTSSSTYHYAAVWPSATQEIRTIEMSVSAQDRFIEATHQHGQGIIEGDAPMTNKAYQKIMIAVKEIRATADHGEAFFLSLLSNEDPSIVKWAAAYLLKSRRVEAETALEKIAETAPPLIAFGAEMTLKEWRAGRLNMD